MENFTETTHYKEIIMRGTYLSMASDIEWIMAMILSQIFKGKENELRNQYGNEIDKFTMEDKLMFVELGFIRYDMATWNKHKEDFPKLHDLRRMRNLFGHGKIDWIGDSNEDLEIVSLKIDPLTGKLDRKPYKMSEIMKELMEYRKSVMSFLNSLKEAVGI